MRQLSAAEWARTRDRVITLSLSDRGPVWRQRATQWLEGRPGSGWFYAMADSFHFGAQIDADAFRQWVMSELAQPA